MKLWTTKRIAAALKVSDATVKRALKKDQVEVLTINRSVKVRDAALTAWLGFDPGVDKVWTLSEIADEIGYSVPSLERSIREGKLESVVVCGRLKRVKHTQLVAWLRVDPLREPEYWRFVKKSPPPRSQDPYLFDLKPAS